MRTCIAILLCWAAACVGEAPAPEASSPEALGEVTQELNGRRCNARRVSDGTLREIKNGYEWGTGSSCCTAPPGTQTDFTCFSCTHPSVSCDFF